MKFRRLQVYERLPFLPTDFRLVQWLVIEPQLSEVEAQFITDDLIAQNAPIDFGIASRIEAIWRSARLHQILQMTYLKGIKNAD